MHILLSIWTVLYLKRKWYLDAYYFKDHNGAESAALIAWLEVLDDSYERGEGSFILSQWASFDLSVFARESIDMDSRFYLKKKNKKTHKKWGTALWISNSEFF